MSDVYKLSTLRDIFDKVPADKIELCMRELAEGMAMAKMTAELLTIAADTAQPGAKAVVEWPESIDWIDDGKGDIGFDFKAGSETLFSARKRAASAPAGEDAR